MRVEDSGAKAIRLSPKVLLADCRCVSDLDGSAVPGGPRRPWGILPLSTPKEPSSAPGLASQTGGRSVVRPGAYAGRPGSQCAGWPKCCLEHVDGRDPQQPLLHLSLFLARYRFSGRLLRIPLAIHYRAHSLAVSVLMIGSQIKVVHVSCSLGKKGGSGRVWSWRCAHLRPDLHVGERQSWRAAGHSSFPFPQIFEALLDYPDLHGDRGATVLRAEQGSSLTDITVCDGWAHGPSQTVISVREVPSQLRRTVARDPRVVPWAIPQRLENLRKRKRGR